MALTKEEFQPQRWWPVHFYGTNALAGNSALIEEVSVAKRFKVQDIRVHFSTAVASAIDLMIYISSILGSEYNTKLLSQAILGVQNVFIHFSEPLALNSADVLTFSTASFIVANVAGLEVYAWAVVED